MKLIFASQNLHKLREAKQIIGDHFELISLADLNFHSELPETHSILDANAREKAAFIYDSFHQNCFAEDTGLEVESLNGEPGTYSARYAGLNRSDWENINLVLEKMREVKNRNARFRTIICLYWQGTAHLIEGITTGTISLNARGEKGFGYDPIFIPKGFDKTYAEMDSALKNSISHRAKALIQLRELLQRFPQ